ncbi:MAG: glycerol acyltransferase [Flavobacteriales bacterium CG18_big_fil_WC_8_21_14_2_50_32_9]|nr:glycerol acyltransferase [Flavobacteriales bacterium]PIQ15027.1 MAG: glycerol acyltransferase [Flavobacteriales bacterium CG18_big_fil_WC_8_21_14_2_50_32_9]PJC62971.1 MAG: glycerol acyltransferase [Flavobacteriales bacterium CG_4_9_14_0_2_um_filter_32_27]
MNFEDIRAYNDEEYQSVMIKLTQIDLLMEAIQFYLPELTLTQIKETLLSFKTIQDFQSEMVCMVIGKMVNHSAKSLTFKGIKDIDSKKNYLFISNHRDIVLDSALINYGLNLNNYNTSEIAIGSNLLSMPWIKDLVRLNKSFIVKRNIPKQEILEASKALSAYINYTLKEKNQSIWIAQREGRAKDGFDKTNPGLLKMFGLCSSEDLLTHLIGLNITPVAISYEYDPCDYLKINELIKKHNGELYSKTENEDNQHMVLGMKGYKGNINIHFAAPINNKIASLSHIKNRNDLLKEIADIIDNEIYKHYYLFASHYVAYDLLHHSNEFENEYTAEEKQTFVDYVEKRTADFKGNDLAKEIFLKMYANPVLNKMKTQKINN